MPDEERLDMPGTTRTATLYIRDMPRDVKDHFKAWCAARGISMTAMITELMRDIVKGKVGKESLSAVQRRAAKS